MPLVMLSVSAVLEPWRPGTGPASQDGEGRLWGTSVAGDVVSVNSWIGHHNCLLCPVHEVPIFYARVGLHLVREARKVQCPCDMYFGVCYCMFMYIVFFMLSRAFCRH